MQDGISLLGVIGVLRDFLARRRLKSVTAMVFMAVTMLFVLAWPTVASKHQSSPFTISQLLFLEISRMHRSRLYSR